MKMQELLKRYKGLHYYKASFDAMVLTIVNNSEVRAVLDSHGLNSRAFVCMTPGNLLVGRKCLEVRMPYDLWHGRVEATTTTAMKIGQLGPGVAVGACFSTDDIRAELAKLRAWVKELAIAGTHVFDAGQQHMRCMKVLGEINKDQTDEGGD